MVVLRVERDQLVLMVDEEALFEVAFWLVLLPLSGEDDLVVEYVIIGFALQVVIHFLFELLGKARLLLGSDEVAFQAQIRVLVILSPGLQVVFDQFEGMPPLIILALEDLRVHVLRPGQTAHPRTQTVGPLDAIITSLILDSRDALAPAVHNVQQRRGTDNLGGERSLLFPGTILHV